MSVCVCPCVCVCVCVLISSSTERQIILNDDDYDDDHLLLWSHLYGWSIISCAHLKMLTCLVSQSVEKCEWAVVSNWTARGAGMWSPAATAAATSPAVFVNFPVVHFLSPFLFFYLSLSDNCRWSINKVYIDHLQFASSVCLFFIFFKFLNLFVFSFLLFRFSLFQLHF